MGMTESLFYVADSPIHGKGLFARKYIGAGEIIGRIDGVPTSTDGEHVLWVDDENGFHVQCDLRFINHSDEPNAVYFDTLEVCALTDIAPGEEITHDYTDSQ
jgi:SET domain-containing protein